MRARRLQIPHVTWMEDVEDAVGEDDAVTSCTRVPDERGECVNVEHL